MASVIDYSGDNAKQCIACIEGKQYWKTFQERKSEKSQGQVGNDTLKFVRANE
jgi:hypothetical protein